MEKTKCYCGHTTYCDCGPQSAEEKAKELVGKFTPHAYGVWDKNGSKEERYHSKQCAIIAVDEIIKALRKDLPEIGLGKGYWYDVKQEINKL